MRIYESVETGSLLEQCVMSECVNTAGNHHSENSKPVSVLLILMQLHGHATCLCITWHSIVNTVYIGQVIALPRCCPSLKSSPIGEDT